MLENPICPVCHTNKYSVSLSISCEWSCADIRYGDNGIHKVHLHTCGKCGSIFIDDITRLEIKENIETKLRDRND